MNPQVDWFYYRMSNEELREELSDFSKNVLGHRIRLDEKLGRCSIARQLELVQEMAKINAGAN